jgi:predicted dehydrogenase
MMKVGIIGCGFMGKIHANCYKLFPDVEVVGVADVDEEKAKEAAQITNSSVLTSDEIISHPEINSIDICLPTHLHKKYVLKCAEKGKNVFCEKPIALSLEDAKEMIEATKESKVKLMIGMVIRFWPEYVEFKKIVDSKRHGRLTSLVCTRLTVNPGKWGGWYADPSKSGGVLDLHIHDVDYIYYLLGKPKAVYSKGRKTDKGYEHIFTFYEYDDKVVFAEAGWDLLGSFGFVHAIRGVFEDGTTLEYNLKYQPLVSFGEERKEIEIPQPISAQVDAGGNISVLAGWYNELKYWLDCLKENKFPEIVTPEDAMTSLEITLKELESAERGEKVIL